MADKQRAQKRKQKSKPSWPVAYRWLAMGTLAVYTAAGVTIVHAQTPAASAPGPQETRFDIPPGQLRSVLSQFEKTTGLRVDTPVDGIGNLASPGVVGVYSTGDALTQLLKGADVRYTFTSPTVVTLELTPGKTSVEVRGTTEGLSSLKYSQPVHDIPQSVSIVPKAVMEQQGSTTLRDTLRNVSGISLAAGEGGAQGDSLTIRGFTARNDLFLDGMRDFGSYYRDPFNTEEVEVIQGPASSIFGRGSTGGAVNQSTKSPGLSKRISGDADFGTDLTRRATFDINQPIGHTGAFRLNLMGDEGNVAGRDVAENRRFGVAPSLAFGLGTPTRLTLSYFHQTADDNPDYGIPWLFNQPAPVARNNYYGFKDGNYLRTYDDIGTARLEHDVNSRFTLRNQVRFANYKRDGLITEAQIPAGTTLATPLSAINITRHEIAVNSIESSFDEQLDAGAHFQTGALQHTFTAGVEILRETSDPTRPNYTNVPTTSLLNPNYNQAFGGSVAITSQVNTTAYTESVYVLDSVRLGRLNVSGGIRWDRFDANYAQLIAPVSSFHRVDKMPSWRAAVTYDLSHAGNLYFAAGTSFNPSAESLALSAATANLPPEKNLNYEFGSKWQLARGFSLRGALFRTEKTNAREPDPNNPLLNVLSGNQRVNGVQLEVRGRVTRRLEVVSGYAYLDGKVTSSQYYPAAIGARLANVPAHTFNFWGEYRLPNRWEAGVGANFVSSRTSSATSPFDPVSGLVKQAPGYWVFNAMVKRKLTEHIDFQVNVANLANRYYYDQLHPAHVILGPGRSAMAGFKYRF